MTKTPPGQINRTGRVSFGSESLSICEDGLGDARRAGGHDAAQAWELAFKRDVFARVIQTLNRLGWTCTMPTIQPSDIKQYGGNVARWSAERKRFCTKGDLKADLSVSGRCISFEMFQSVNTPTRSDHEGRYESNKEAIMPYPLRLEMERTRRRIRDYLCNVFAGYTFTPPKISSPNPDPLAYFNDGWDGEYEKLRGTHRFRRGSDGWPNDIQSSDRRDRDGVEMDHGDVRWWRNHTGVLLRGRVFGGINGMWIFVYGPGQRDYTHASARSFLTYKPGETIAKLVDPSTRRKRLERLMQDAIKAMDFRRAQVLKDILFPTGPLYAIWHKEKSVYFGVMYSGYHNSITDAGRYTRAELKPYLGTDLETERFKAILISN